MSRETGKTKVDQDIPDLTDLYRDSPKVGEVGEVEEEYEDLDPEKCKAKDSEPIKVAEEFTIEWIKKKTKERKDQFEDSKVPGENLNFDLIFDFPPINVNEDQDIKKNRSLMVEASYLMNREIKIGNGPYVKVISVKMFTEGVFIEIEEKVGGQSIYYEIPYQKDLMKAEVM